MRRWVIEPTGGDPGQGARRARRRLQATVAAVLLAALALGTASVRALRDDGDDVRATSPIAVDPTLDPTATTHTLPPTTGTTREPPPSEPPPPGRRRLVADAHRGWELLLVDADGCLELRVGEWREGGLLCNPAPVADIVGDVVSVATPLGPITVAVVAPSVTGLDAFVGMPGRAAPHPDTRDVAYAAVEAGYRGDGRLPELMVRSGDDTVAKVTLPARIGSVRRSELTVLTTPPYGRWPGYRHAGNVGLLFGGLQVLGFHDGTGGAPCLLYRRLGNAHEGVIADACPARDRSRPLVFARLTPVPMETPEPGYVLVALSDRPVSAWRCERVSGEDCGGNTEVFRDPRGSGRVALAQFAEWVRPGPHDRVVLVLTVGGEEQRVEVPVPR